MLEKRLMKTNHDMHILDRVFTKWTLVNENIRVYLRGVGWWGSASGTYSTDGLIGSHFKNHHYRPQRSWGKVMFLQASVILLTGGGHAWFYSGGGHAWFYSGGGHAWFYWGGVRGFIRGACVVLFGGGVHGFIWGGACVVLFGGGMRGFIRGGHAWFYSGGHAWFYSGGACVVLFRGGRAWFFQFLRIQWDTVNERAVRILLECILVLSGFPSPWFPLLSTVPRNLPLVDSIWIQLLFVSQTNNWPRPFVVTPTAFIHLSIPGWLPPKYHISKLVPVRYAWTPPQPCVVISKSFLPQVTQHISRMEWSPVCLIWILIRSFVGMGG